MRFTGVDSGLEVASIADIPSGTGMVSSSSFTVEMPHAVHAFGGRYKTAEELAQEACRVEIEILGEPVGKQDQYAAAFGGLRCYWFNLDGTVFVDPLICSPEMKTRYSVTCCFSTWAAAATPVRFSNRRRATPIAGLETCGGYVASCMFWEILAQRQDVAAVGQLLHEGWLAKKELADNVSNERIDHYYAQACAAGALGAKFWGQVWAASSCSSASRRNSRRSATLCGNCARSASASSRRAARSST